LLKFFLGAFNRVFRLCFDIGNDLIARIPFRNAGPRSLLTQSEVATMDFVRTHLGAPIPKVLTWSASPDNDVGCEYIIMEECEGELLATMLESSSDASQFPFNIAKLMSDMAAIPFSQYGSLFYKEDVEPELQARPLYEGGLQPDDSSERFRIGPSVERRFYRGERAHMPLDRGPCEIYNCAVLLLLTCGLGKDIHSYIKAIADCEIKWIQSYSTTGNALNQLGSRHSADQHVSLLEKWVSLAPAVLPSPPKCRPTLSHPDLHAANIFVNKSKFMPVTAVIDWQGAAVRPLFETGIPDFVDTGNLDYVTALNNDPGQDTKDPFLKSVHELRPELFDVLRLRQMEELRRAIYYSSHSWSDGLPLLEQCLILLSAAYRNYIPANSDYPTSPFVFSKEDLRRNEDELNGFFYVEERLDALIRARFRLKGYFLHKDGSVDATIFEVAQREATEAFKFFSKTVEDPVRFEQHWPLRERKFVLSNELCM
jgi:hypothetical protein